MLASFPLPLKQSVQQSISYDMMLVMVWVLVLITMWDQHTNNYIQCVCAVCIDSAIHPIKPRRNIDQIPITHYHGYKLLYLHYLLSYHNVNILQNVSSVTLWYKCEGLNIMWMTYDINIIWKFSSLSLCDIFFPFRETVDFSFHGKQYPWLPLWNNFHIKISKMFKKWESCVQDSKLC